MATETTAPARCLQLPCPCCGEPQANITLHLWEADTFTCTECEADFTTDDLRERIEKWGKLLTWIEAMPGE